MKNKEDTIPPLALPTCSAVLSAAEEIANAIGALCAAQGGVVDVGTITRKTAAAIERHTSHTDMRNMIEQIATSPCKPNKSVAGLWQEWCRNILKPNAAGQKSLAGTETPKTR